MRRPVARMGGGTGKAGHLRDEVRARYARAAVAGCGCASECCGEGGVLWGGGLYDPSLTTWVPEAALASSLGCANPTAVAELTPGETVLDLGSGGGLDALLSARRVGPTGRVYGLDMTDEMLALAGENARAAGASNVRFLKGYIEDIPLPDGTVDVVISNCVVNLSPDKPRVFSEVFRVLKDRGRIALTDVVADGPSPEGDPDLEQWAECLAGALTREAYAEGLEAAGFEDVEIVDSHRVAEGRVSAIIRASKRPR